MDGLKKAVIPNLSIWHTLEVAQSLWYWSWVGRLGWLPSGIVFKANFSFPICTESQDITKKSSKICLPNQTGKIWHILAGISGLGYTFQNQFLRWNRESKPVDLNTMNPIIGIFFCQAQPQLQLQLWLSLVLVSIPPKPPTHPSRIVVSTSTSPNK